ncbi:MAG: universal stress protein [Betaproteobacteria bacterium]|nr:universal stress protein [Betaproteobacteria bacterium]
MLKWLVAIDGSENADRAIDHVIKLAGMYREPLEIHLLNVQLPLAGVNVKLFVAREDLNAYYHDEGTAALKGARERLDAAGIGYVVHIGVGDPADVIVRYAVDKGCGQIVVGSRGMGALSNLVVGSVASKVIQLARVPVLLVR